jgi:predicted DCC family thiol-disulfide oxidoreductase YuxK
MSETLMIFDTNCVLCSGAVRFILKHERDSDIQFVNAWSETGLAIGAKHGLSKDDLNKTFLFIRNGRGFTHSTATLELARHLKMPWRALRLFWIVPKPLRDWAYRFIATRRYRIFGYEENCLVIRQE